MNIQVKFKNRISFLESVLYANFHFTGYDTIPVEMQGLEIGGAMALPDFTLDELPQPPQDNNQVAAWYDTDL